MMRKYLTGVMIAVLAAAMLYAGTAFADHRQGNLVVLGGTLSLTGRFAEPAGRCYNARKLNINVKIFAGTVGPAMPKFVEELGSTAEYVLGFSNWEPRPVLGHPGMKEFIEKYKERYGEKPNYHAAMGYGAMQIMEAAVKHTGNFDPERIRDALASIRVETIMGPWKVNEQSLSNREGLTFQIQSDERMIVWPAHKAEAKFLLMSKWEDRPKE